MNPNAQPTFAPNIDITEKIQGSTFSPENLEQQQRVERTYLRFSESCTTKSVFAGVSGFGFGIMWGLFTAALNTTAYSPHMPNPSDFALEQQQLEVKPRKPIKMPSLYQFSPKNIYKGTAAFLERIKFFEGMRSTWQRTVFMGKAFGGVAIVYSAVECAIEKTRAKHDIYNSLSAGCITGAALAGRAGPKAAAAGCAGFAAFSLIIDSIFQL